MQRLIQPNAALRPGFAPSGRRRALVLGVAGALLVGGAALCPYRAGVVVGASMKPTLGPGQWFAYRRLAAGEDVSRGDVVIVRLGGRLCVKRVQGLSGDRLWTAAPRNVRHAPPMLIDGSEPIERWKRRFPNFRFGRLEVPAGHLFLLGDGGSSLDSRELGPAPESAVLGKVIRPSTVQPPEAESVLTWIPEPRAHDTPS